MTIHDVNPKTHNLVNWLSLSPHLPWMRSSRNTYCGLRCFSSWAHALVVRPQCTANKQYQSLAGYLKASLQEKRTYALLSSEELAFDKKPLKASKQMNGTRPGQYDHRHRLSKFWIPPLQARKVKDVAKGRTFNGNYVMQLKYPKPIPTICSHDAALLARYGHHLKCF